MVLSSERTPQRPPRQMDGYCIRQSGIPHATRLFTDFLYQFERVAEFYGSSPFDEKSYQQVIDRLKAGTSYRPEVRATVSRVLAGQAAAWGAGPTTLRNIERLKNGALAVVTGQQVGLFGGPMFSVYKALTAVRLAERLTERGVDCVPVFWLATEDHDLEEINHTFLLDENRQPLRTEDRPEPHTEHAPVGEVRLGAGVGNLVSSALALVPSEHRSRIGEALRSSYRPGETYGSAFARLMGRLLESSGVVMMDPMHPELRRVAAPVFRQAIESANDLGSALLARDRALARAGYHSQVHVTESSTLLFQRHEGQRVVLRRRNGEFIRGDQMVEREELLAHVDERPEDFSANVLLRPIVQDVLLPTVSYVGGPAEVAYFAQLNVLHSAFLGSAALVHPRASLTLLDGEAASALGRYGITLADVLAGPVLAENMASRLLPENVSGAFASGQRRLNEALSGIRSALEGFDPTLAAAAETSTRKIAHQWHKIRRKAARASALRSSEIAADAQRLTGFLFPHRSLQERVYSTVSLLGHFRADLPERLTPHFSVDCPDHQVVVV